MDVAEKSIIYHNRPVLGEEEIEAVVDSLRALDLTSGNRIARFEEDFSKFLGIGSVAVSSGTAALHLALDILGISDNDEIILPAYTCVTVPFPILYQRAIPILADVGEDYNVSAKAVAEKITHRTRAVIMPHMFGYPAEVEQIRKVCDDNGLYLIEDCCQTVGATYKGRKVGLFGDISIFSFYATKMFTSIQGGMLCTANEQWLATARDIREPDQYRGIDDEFDDRLKYRYTMSDIEASVGRVQLGKLDNFISRRCAIASIYREVLGDSVVHPPVDVNRTHVYSRYVVRTSHDPALLIELMKEKGISCSRMHLPPLHRRSILVKYNRIHRFEMTDMIVNSSLSLPIYPSLSDEEARYVAVCLKDVLDGLK